jgi:glucose-6-phosphate isomerase
MANHRITDIHLNLEVMARKMRRSNSLQALFAQDAARTEHLTLHCGRLHADLSKNFIDPESLLLLKQLADARNLSGAIADLFAGNTVNNTEQRPALHVALRGHIPEARPEIAITVGTALHKMAAFVADIHKHRWLGHSGKAIADIVNLGIGGSDLGPAMATAALRPFHTQHVRCHFVSNVDPSHIKACLQTLNPETTLFIVASKSFGTLETLQNALHARKWLLDSGADAEATAAHFVAISSNLEAARAFGIHPDNIFPMWDWVGGRYSLWSAIGLPIALATDMQTFYELLNGAAMMDQHFKNTPFMQNIPVMLGLLAVWYRNYWQTSSQAILPYAQDLHMLPGYLQQLSMESLGKSVDIAGIPVAANSGAVIWGSAGTNGQHSFHQLLHQGTDLIPADFIAAAVPAAGASIDDLRQHHHLLANCFSQSRALMCGKTLEQARQATGDSIQAQQLALHKVIPGNRPSTTILLDSLDAETLGSLLAMYEHQVYVQSVLWDINAFDQWGVELGKQLSAPIFAALHADTMPTGDLDTSTLRLIAACRSAALGTGRSA